MELKIHDRIRFDAHPFRCVCRHDMLNHLTIEPYNCELWDCNCPRFKEDKGRMGRIIQIRDHEFWKATSKYKVLWEDGTIGYYGEDIEPFKMETENAKN